MSNSLGGGVLQKTVCRFVIQMSYRFKTILNAEGGYLRGDMNPSKDYHGNKIFFKE